MHQTISTMNDNNIKYSLAIEVGTETTRAALIATNTANGESRIDTKAKVDTNGFRYGLLENNEDALNTLSELIEELNLRESNKRASGAYILMNGLAYDVVHTCINDANTANMTLDNMTIERMTRDALESEQSHISDNDSIIAQFQPIYHRIPEIKRTLTTNQITTNSFIRPRTLDTTYIYKVYKKSNDFLQSGTNGANFKCSYQSVIHAKSQCLLTDEEKQLGVLIIDFGASTTSMAIYFRNTLYNEISLPYGSDSISFDLSMAFSSSRIFADILKKNVGLGNDFFNLDLPQIADIDIHGEKRFGIRTDKPAFVAWARVQEIVSFIKQFIAESKKSLDNSFDLNKVVITGKGSHLKGLRRHLENELNIETQRVSSPRIQTEEDEMEYSAIIGLLDIISDETNRANKGKQMTLFDPFDNVDNVFGDEPQSSETDQPATQTQHNSDNAANNEPANAGAVGTSNTKKPKSKKNALSLFKSILEERNAANDLEQI